MKDNHNDMVPAVALNLQTVSSDTTTNGNIIDLQGFESCEFVFVTGTVTDGDYAVLMHEGDAADLGDAAAIADADLIGTEALASFAADTDDNVLSKIGYKGGKRYVRLSVVSSSTSSGAVLGAVCIKGHPAHAPKSDQTP